MKKKILSLVLALAMCLTLCVPAMATMITDNSEETPEVLFPSGIVSRGPKYHYKTVYTDPQIKTATRRVNGQPTIGTVLEAGDGMTYYSYSASSASFNVSCALPSPYGTITVGVSIPIGSVNSLPGIAGITKFAPSDGTYVLLVEKTYSVRGYVTYEALSGTENWHYYASGGSVYDNNILERPFLEKVD